MLPQRHGIRSCWRAYVQLRQVRKIVADSRRGVQRRSWSHLAKSQRRVSGPQFVCTCLLGRSFLALHTSANLSLFFLFARDRKRRLLPACVCSVLGVKPKGPTRSWGCDPVELCGYKEARRAARGSLRGTRGEASLVEVHQ